MGARIRAHDWSQSPLGLPETWPAPLRTIVGIMLAANQAMFVAWGPERAMLYNDAYAEILGNKHPAALGRPFAEVWSELADSVGPIMDRAYAGVPTCMDDIELVMMRKGYPEETHFSFFYAPVCGAGDDGRPDNAIQGVYCACTEITGKVFAERRAAFRARLEDRLRGLSAPNDIMAAAAEELGRQLGAAQVAYADVVESGEVAVIESDWNDGTVPSIVGRYRLDDYGVTGLKQGEPLMVEDVRRDPRTCTPAMIAGFERIGVAAFLNLPLIKDGRLVAVLAINRGVPRVWSPADIALARDVAERTWAAVEQARAEAALRASEARFRELADNISQFVWTADPDGWIYWYNKQWFDYTGTTLEEMQGWGWRAVHHPGHVDRVVRKISHAFATGEPWEDTFPLRGRDGRYRWFLSRALPIRDDAGRIVRWFGTNTDIDDLKRVQDEAERTSALLNLIGDSTPDLIYAKDRESRILYANAAVRKLLGRPLENIIGGSDPDWMTDPKQADAVLANDRRVIDTGATLDVDEAFTGADGRTGYFRSIKAPLRDRSGGIIGLVGVTSDMTARKEAEERERLLAREVDHRAKNMLAVVQSLVQLTRAETMADLKEAITGRIQALARAHRLLAAARWEGVDLLALANEELSPFLDRAASHVAVNGPPLRLKPEAAQALALVLHELVTNAAKYGALSVDGGQLDVEWAVRTDGTGERCLELHWCERRGPPVTAPSRTGFGSTVIRASVERQLRGTLAMDWRAEGLACTLTLPADLLTPCKETAWCRSDIAQHAPVEPAVPPGRSVLVVEDESLIAMQIEAALTQAGWTVIGPASNIAEAVECLHGKRADMAVLDVNLAGEPSFPIADILAAKRIPFAFCTGYAGVADLPERFRKAPVIPKPFSAESLVAVLSRFQPPRGGGP